jgi:hypothetical protein
MQGGVLAPLAAPITPLCKATDRGAAGVQAHQLLNIASGTDLSSPCVILCSEIGVNPPELRYVPYQYVFIDQ